MRTAASVVLAALALASCGIPGEEGDALTVTISDSAGVEIVSIAGPVESLPEWRLSAEPLAVVSGGVEPFLSWVGEIEILGDGRFWIEDNQSAGLYLFEADASGFRTAAREGDGPGEFRNLTELSLGVGDTAFAFDRRLYRISAFDGDGDFVSSVQVGREFGGPLSRTLDAWGLGSDRLLLLSLVRLDTTFAREPRRDYNHADLYALDQDAEIRGAPARFPGGYSVRSPNGDAGAHFAASPLVAAGAGVVLWSPAEDYDVTLASPLLDPRRIVRWRGWREALGDSLMNHVRETVAAGLEPFRQQQPDLVERMLEAYFDPAVLPDTLPALGPGILDDRGRIWLARFRPATEGWNQEDVWHVLSADGRPVARLPLPPSTQLKAVRGDRVAVVFRDDLEVEHVRIHRLITEDR